MDASPVLAGHQVIPVVVINDPRMALKLTSLFLEAGMNCIEVTLRTENALSCIEVMVKEFPDAKIGAGSVLTPDQLREADIAGAKFAVSPGSSDELITAATSTPWLPGVATASEILKLKSEGYRTMKFFPAELLGGVNTIRALSAPIPCTQFVPTGGVHESNLMEYLDLDCVSCVGGSWLAPKSDIENGRWLEIEARIKKLKHMLTLN